MIIIYEMVITVNSCLADTPLIRTSAEFQAEKWIAEVWRIMTDINSCYYGLSLMGTLTQGPYSVRDKGVVDCIVHQNEWMNGN